MPKLSINNKLILANVVIYFISHLFPETTYDLFFLHTFDSYFYFSWQLVTYQFIHVGLVHLIYNMIWLYILGYYIEETYGSKMLWLYLSCGVFAGIFHNISISGQSQELTLIGASGSVWGIMAIYALTFPKQKVNLFFSSCLAVETRWVILFFFIVEIISALLTQVGDDIAHANHVGGAIAGTIFYILLKYKSKN